jgi:hypothetical protein
MTNQQQSADDKASVARIFDSYFTADNVACTEETSKQLVQITESSLSSSSSSSDVDYTAHIIFDDILARVRSTTHDDPLHERAIEIIQALKGTKSDKRDWSQLQPLGMTIRELWNGNLSENSVDGWASLNSFVARLAQREIVPGGFDPYGIWSMRSALETDDDDVEGHVPAAAVWPIYAGTRMYNLSKQGGEESRTLRGGNKWTGKAAYSLERWQFWKGELQKISENQSFQAKPREIAKQALGAMH